MTTTTAPIPAAARRRGSAPSTRAAWGFLTPFLVGFAVFYLVPIGYVIYKSLYGVRRSSTFGPIQEVFVGLANYRSALGDGDFVRGIGRIALFGFVQVPVMLLIALVLALLLDSARIRFTRFFRLAFFVPYAVPGAIAAIMWGFLYAPSLSPFNQLTRPLGADPDLLSADVILWSIANLVTWTYAGYNMLIMYSALQAIPADLYEAARIDGASDLQIAWRIKVPIIAPAVVLTAVFSIIGTLQLFTEPQVMATVSTAISSSYTPTIAAYAQISAQNYGLGAAMSVIITVATVVLSVVFFRLTRKRVEG
ncbi:carbohydrate ABC transporter permease [Kribbella italica]|uniref:Multiple sugar transport system permease protein n=1 Tax=Kribbella italica TaxID=1540520 RepID=A0A7W9J507_9ACTN|nr:sugar ABC transporter permease [Kribbella italica]MBB5835747.1 multiple sugar transport system permease protein [Kribbella italica]